MPSKPNLTRRAGNLVWAMATFLLVAIPFLFLPILQADNPSKKVSLAFSTYVGGSKQDSIRGCAVDEEGNLYLTGGTESSNFPTTPGAYSRKFNGWHDVFVMKVAPSGSIMWSTFIGGPNYDRAYGIEVDGRGYVYITGRAGPGFPVTQGTFQTSFQGCYEASIYGHQNAFIAKLAPDGSRVVWAAYFGTHQGNRDLAIDQSGNIYVVSGYDPAKQVPFPEQWFRDGFQKKPQGGTDIILAKVKSDGSRVLWATYFGGSSDEDGAATVRIDAAGFPYITTSTTSIDMPTTPGAYNRTAKGGADIYVGKFTPDGSTLVYGTYLGGSQGDAPAGTHGMAVDSQGNVHVAGQTFSLDFPTTPGSIQPTYGGSRRGAWRDVGDIFVSKLSADGSRLLASTFVGGRYADGVEGVSVDPWGNVYVTGFTFSDNFPVTPDAFQAGYQGNQEAFIVKLSPDLKQVLYSTYMGGSRDDAGRCNTVDSKGNFYLGGWTKSDNWPTHKAFQNSRAGDWDGVLAKFTLGAATGSN